MTDTVKYPPTVSFTGWLLGIQPSTNNTYQNPAIWLNDIYNFIANSNDVGAIDLLFANIDDLLIDHKIDLCEHVLNIIELDKLNKNLLIGLLVITNSAKNYLPTRSKIILDIRKILEKTESEEHIEGLLKGLL